MKKNCKMKSIFLCFLLMLFMSLPVQATEIEEEIIAERQVTISNKREFLEFVEK